MAADAAALPSLRWGTLAKASDATAGAGSVPKPDVLCASCGATAFWIHDLATQTREALLSLKKLGLLTPGALVQLENAERHVENFWTVTGNTAAAYCTVVVAQLTSTRKLLPAA